MAFIDSLVIIVYFAAMIAVGFWYRKRASEDLEAYFLGGKQMNWLQLAMSGSVSTFDITGTMWMVSVLFLLGFRSWWHHWMWGLMLPAFGLAFMGIWVRRSRVITGAEWMVTRFGKARDGRVARTAYALLAVITQASFIAFTFQGIGKFATVFVPLAELMPNIPFVVAYEAELLGVLIFLITTLYVVMGGLFSVVITDVIQTVVLTVAGLVIAAVAFNEVSPEMVSQMVPDGWVSLWPTWKMEPLHEGMDLGAYELFGALAVVWIAKGFMLNAGGPGQMYDFQRYLAAKDARDSAKLSAAWPFFLVIRWAMVAGITLLAMAGVASISDPELIMPVILQTYLPVGFRGLVIAGLLAAFMSTFSSTANSGASYIVRDLWQPFVEGKKSEEDMIRYSYVATIGMVVGGTLIGLQADTLAGIFDWIMMALGGGVIIPNLLRWYWWRLNGWGYAAGTLGGILLAVVALFFPESPAYVTFPLIVGGSLIGCVVVSLATAPTHRDVLESFYAEIRPFGAWGPVKKNVPPPPPRKRDVSYSVKRAVFNTAVAIAGITGLYLAPMFLVGHWYLRASVWGAIAATAIVVLYFTWYRYLPPPRTEDDPVPERRREGESVVSTS